MNEAVAQVLVQFVSLLTTVLTLAILARALLSWIPSLHHSALMAVLVQITEPILGPIRRILPRTGMFDFSPMVAIFLLFFIQRVVIALLTG